MNLGKAIKVLRVENDLDQRGLSVLCGFDPSYVSIIESNKRRPSLKSFARIAEVLGVLSHELMKKAEGYNV